MPQADDARYAELDALLRFETLLATLSASLAFVEPPELDRQIDKALTEVLSFFAADRCLLVAIDPDEGAAHVSHAAYAAGVEQLPVSLNLAERFPWLTARLRDSNSGGEAICITQLSDLPREAQVDRAAWETRGVKSNIVLPLRLGDRVRHVIVLHWIRAVHDEAKRHIPRLRLLGEIIVTALDRTRAHQVVKESQARLNLVAASAGAGLWDMNVATGEIWATPAAKTLYGFAPDHDVHFREVLDVVHPEDREAVRTRLQMALRQRTAYNAEYRLLFPDGRLRWISARGRPHASVPGSDPDRLMGISLDITERKAAEARLEQSEERYRSLVELSADAVVVHSDGHYVFANQAALDLYGVSSETLMGARVLNFVDPADRPVIEQRIRQAGTTAGEGSLAEVKVVRPDGEIRHVEASGTPIEFQGRPAVLAILRDITERKRAEEELRQALAEVRRLRDQLQRENVYLRQEVKGLHRSSQIIGHSEAIRRAVAQIEQVAPTTSTVLLLGETGTGKERFATAIHELSPRRGRAMIRVNCAAIPATLIESELFGREKGAYTGALSRQAGRFEAADGSTIFIDEIGDLPIEVQIKLLRVLQERQIERLGSPKPIPVDVRIITATNQDLARLVGEGRFRQDLYYRLNVFPIMVPPLRDRREDIPLLVQALLDELGVAIGKRVDSVAASSIDALMHYDWPGNIRELRNVIERAIILASGPSLTIELPTSPGASKPAPKQDIKAIERDHIFGVLQQTGWRIRGARGAAAVLGLKPTTLEHRMAKLGILRPWTKP